MLITNKNDIINFCSHNRLWQGVPGIEITKGGRIFSTFYSGGTKESVNNFIVLTMSDDGVNFSEPVAVLFRENYRCYDPCIWIDPLDRLWFIWACAPEHAVYAVICDNPDADELTWSEEFIVGKDVMMNKPTVLSTGEWLFPIAVWHNTVFTVGGFNSKEEDTDRRAFAYKTIDGGKTFSKLGGSDIEKRSFDEHMIVELTDGSLAMYVRTTYGIGVSYSYDRGRTWTEGGDSGLGGPCSRFYIGRLKSGRLLLVNHYEFTGRSHLTAMLSEDDGKTWPYKFLIDERSNVSYPDATQDEDGFIYITYDRERGTAADTMEKIYASAREILYAKITEEDIICGKLTNKDSKLRCIISKLDQYAKEDENPFNEVSRFSDEGLAKYICEKSNDELIGFIFDHYRINCVNMHEIGTTKLDSLIEELNSENSDRDRIIRDIISLVRSVTADSAEDCPVVERVKNIIRDDIADELSVRAIAEKLGISMYYISHLFKKATGITIVDYKKELKITRAKNFLVNTDKKISQIAQECGFGSDSYFSKVFMASENLSPTQYREFAKKCKKQTTISR